MIPALESARDTRRPVVLMTGAVLSPTRKALIEDLRATRSGAHARSLRARGSPGRAPGIAERFR